MFIFRRKEEKWTVQGTANDSQSNENTQWPDTSIDTQNNDWRMINLRTNIEVVTEV